MLDTYRIDDFAQTHENERVKCAVYSVYSSPHSERSWFVRVSFDEDGRAVAAVGKLGRKVKYEG